MPAPVDRPAVVLLHSSAASSRQWNALAESLKETCRVLTVDFHGHGERAEWDSARPMALADDAALALPLLEQAGGAHVVGHSYGGAVAVKLACMRPHLVRSVVAYEPVLFRLLVEDLAHPEHIREVQRVANGMAERVQGGHPALAARSFVDFWSGAGAWQKLSPGQQQGMERRSASVVRHFEALFAEPFPREQLARFGAPMLFMSGSRTVPAARRVMQLLRFLLPLADHEELSGLGHLGPMTHAPAVNELIRDFLLQQR